MLGMNWQSKDHNKRPVSYLQAAYYCVACVTSYGLEADYCGDRVCLNRMCRDADLFE